MGLARVLQDAGRRHRRCREAARAQDSLRRADARRARRVERRDAIRFSLGPRSLPRSSRRARRRSRRTIIASASGNIRTSRFTRRCSRISRRAASCCGRDTASRTCSSWDTAPETSPFGNVLTPLPESGIVDFTNPAAYAWWRDAHKRAVRRRRRRDQERLRRARARRRVASNGDDGRRLHNVYPLLYNRCVFEATGRFQRRRRRPADGLEPRRLVGQPALPDRLGRRSAKRLGGTRGVDSRRTVVGHERQPVSQLRHRRLLRRRAAVGRAVRPLAAGGGVRLAHPRARHRRARALGVRPGGRSDRAEVARVPLSPDSVSRARDRRSAAAPACR